MTDRIPLDAMTSDQLDALYDRIATLEHVAAGNKRHVQLIVPEMDRLNEDLEQAQNDAELHARNTETVARERETYRQAWKEAQRMRAKAEERAKQTEAAIASVRHLVEGAAATTSAGISDYDIGRHEMAVAVLAALDEPPCPAAAEATDRETTTRVLAALHRSAEQDVSRAIALYERWVKAGPPPLGTSMSRWWDTRLAELHTALNPTKEQ